MEKERRVKLIQPICPECGSKQVLYRKGDKKNWCRRCGHEWFKKNKKTKMRGVI